MLKIDQTTPEGKRSFKGLQNIWGIFFIIFEAAIYVLMGGLAPAAGLAPDLYSAMQFMLILQLFFGGMLILFMAEVVDKWGFGSGISIFIAAGVSQQIFVRAFSPLTTTGQMAFGSGLPPVGAVWVFFKSILNADLTGAALPFFAIFFTVVVFIMAVYAQAMKVDIPLSFGRIRGHGIRWPLKFIYTSNIPVILVAALMANFQLWARLLQNKAGETGVMSWISQNILGQFSGQMPVSGLVYWTHAPNMADAVINKYFTPDLLLQCLTYILFMVGGAVIFSIFWVQTAGMDAKSQAKNILNSGLQMPGFRRDPRVLEKVLKRYITPLTVMGGAAVGVLAAVADLSGALSRGTGILLTVMIIYRLYEEVAQQHMMDMNPALRKMMQG
ncbi:preprotein translocase subunit SecY [archaeon]|nr:preprotein translocase subunit SecY [archaeon]